MLSVLLMPMNCNAEMKEVLPIVDYDLCPHLSGTNTEPEIKDYFRHRNTSSLDRLRRGSLRGACEIANTVSQVLQSRLKKKSRS